MCELIQHFNNVLNFLYICKSLVVKSIWNKWADRLTLMIYVCCGKNTAYNVINKLNPCHI